MGKFKNGDSVVVLKYEGIRNFIKEGAVYEVNGLSPSTKSIYISDPSGSECDAVISEDNLMAYNVSGGVKIRVLNAEHEAALVNRLKQLGYNDLSNPCNIDYEKGVFLLAGKKVRNYLLTSNEWLFDNSSKRMGTLEDLYKDGFLLAKEYKFSIHGYEAEYDLENKTVSFGCQSFSEHTLRDCLSASQVPGMNLAIKRDGTFRTVKTEDLEAMINTLNGNYKP